MHKQYVDGNKEGGSKRNNKKTWIEWNNQTKEEWEINTLKYKQIKKKKQQDTKNIHCGITLNKEQQHTRGSIYKFSAIVFRNRHIKHRGGGTWKVIYFIGLMVTKLLGNITIPIIIPSNILSILH